MSFPSLPARLMRRLQTALRTLRIDFRTLRLALAVSRQAPAVTEAPVIFFNASTRIRGHSLNAAFSLLAAWSLRLQGIPVVHFVCRRGMSMCLQGADQDDVYAPMPCDLCLRQSFVNYAGSKRVDFTFKRDMVLTARLSGLDMPGLISYEHPFEDMLVPIGELVLPSLRWRLRRYSLADDESTRFLYREFILSALNILMEFQRLLNSGPLPRAVVVFNGQTFPEAVVRWLALKRGVRAITHEVSLPPLSAFFTEGEATAWPMPMPADFQLTAGQNAQVEALLQARSEGKFSMAGIHFYPEMKGLDETFQQKAAGFKQVVPVFTNVIFDTSQQHSNAFFANMYTWLETLQQVIRRHGETLFVVRAHPDESRPGKSSRESVAMWVAKTGLDTLPNVVFVPPEEYISSYELMGRAKFILIYNSTVGLEASMLGIPVLAGGRGRSTHLNTMYFPSSQPEYLQLLESFLAAEEVHPEPDHLRNARRFFYFHYFIASLPFGDFIEPTPQKGFVRWKAFKLQALLPETSRTMRAITKGILRSGDFTLRE